MVAVIVNGTVNKNLARRFKYCVAFEGETGERFHVLRDDEKDVRKDIEFFGPDRWLSIAIRH